jgi:hypothetical protein
MQEDTHHDPPIAVRVPLERDRHAEAHTAVLAVDPADRRFERQTRTMVVRLALVRRTVVLEREFARRPRIPGRP